MGSAIVVRGAGDIRANLAPGCFSRLHGIQAWGTLRVGIRATLRGATSPLDNFPRLSIGICNGTTNLPLSDSCNHFLGWSTNTSSVNAVAFASGAYYDNMSVQAVQMQNSAAFSFVGSAATNFRMWTRNSGEEGWMLLFCDIINGGVGAWTVKGYYTLNTQSIDFPTSTDFQDQMALAVPTWSKNGMNTLSSAITVDESTYGTLNAGCVFWNRAIVSLDVLDVAIVRLA